MRVALDTSALNWLADTAGTADDVVRARDVGLLEVMVMPEAALEIRATRNPERRATLEAVLSRFFPLTPTRIPRVGTARAGMCRLPTSEDLRRLNAVGFLVDGPDRHLATNAAGYRCDAFITRDGEMVRDKVRRLEQELGGTRVISPEVFMSEVHHLLNRVAP